MSTYRSALLHCELAYIRGGPCSCHMGNLENLTFGRVAFWVTFSIVYYLHFFLTYLDLHITYSIVLHLRNAHYIYGPIRKLFIFQKILRSFTSAFPLQVQPDCCNLTAVHVPTITNLREKIFLFCVGPSACHFLNLNRLS